MPNTRHTIQTFTTFTSSGFELLKEQNTHASVRILKKTESFIRALDLYEDIRIRSQTHFEGEHSYQGVRIPTQNKYFTSKSSKLLFMLIISLIVGLSKAGPEQTLCGKGCLVCKQDSCLQCITGYFLDKTSSKCSPCGSNCVQCNSEPVCETCDLKFKRVELKNRNVVCQARCPPNCNQCDTSGKCSQCSLGFEIQSDKTCEKGEGRLVRVLLIGLVCVCMGIPAILMILCCCCGKIIFSNSCETAQNGDFYRDSDFTREHSSSIMGDLVGQFATTKEGARRGSSVFNANIEGLEEKKPSVFQEDKPGQEA